MAGRGQGKPIKIAARSPIPITSELTPHDNQSNQSRNFFFNLLGNGKLKMK